MQKTTVDDAERQAANGSTDTLASQLIHSAQWPHFSLFAFERNLTDLFVKISNLNCYGACLSKISIDSHDDLLLTLILWH